MPGMSTDHRYLPHAIAWCIESVALTRKPSLRPRPIRTSSRT
jgi:hypothetical protein